MADKEITISLPEEQVVAIEAAVQAGEVPSMSAFISQAVAARMRGDELETLLDDLVAQYGEPLPEDYAGAEAAFAAADAAAVRARARGAA